jgi:hypothetical protein
MSRHDPEETYDIVWAVIENDLEPLARQVEAVLRVEFPPSGPPSSGPAP